MKYTKEEMLGKVDHTLLKPEATWPQIQTLCDEAIANHCASVCINTCYVAKAAEYMAGRVPVCCVVGFPLGAMDTKSKAFEAKTAVENGASEVDMVINIGWLKNKQYDDVRNDIAAVKAAVGDKVLKVIIETCLLTEEEKIKMCDIVPEAGADFIKTSTGFSTGGATFHDIELFAEHVKGRCNRRRRRHLHRRGHREVPRPRRRSPGHLPCCQTADLRVRRAAGISTTAPFLKKEPKKLLIQ